MIEIEIRRMQPSEVEAVADVDSYAYLSNPRPVAIYQGNSETERKIRRKTLIEMYTNNPQKTYIAKHEEKIVGFIRSSPCSGNLFSAFPFSLEEHNYFISQKIEHLSLEERQKWWLMTWEKHDPAIPHSHLGPFGVLPEFQGQGIGKKLMENYLNRLDRTGRQSYLETGKPKNVRFYKKFGYQLMETDFALGIDFIFMWRPRAQAD